MTSLSPSREPSAVDVSVVLPCLDEEGSVGTCVTGARQSLAGTGVSHEVVVCDNGSRDSSPDEAVQAGARLVHEPRRGYGAALTSGIEAARGRILILADADGSYPLEELPAFVGRVRAAGGIVLGSRFKGRILPGSMPLSHRFIGTPVTRVFLRLLYRVRCSDPHCGLRAMTRETFEAVRPQSTGMEFAIEMLVNAGKRGVPISELPITYRPRRGQSKLRAIPDGWRLVRLLLLHGPTPVYVVPGLTGVAVGLAALLLLATGDVRAGSVTFSFNTMVVASVLTIASYQLVALGLSARAYLFASGGADESALLRQLTLRRAVLAGLLVGAVGLVLLAAVAVDWLASGLGSLSARDGRVALLGLTGVVLGVQTFFAAFLLSLFLGGERDFR